MATVLKSADLVDLDRTVRAAFETAYNAPETYTPIHTQFATTQQSMSRENLYPLAMDASTIREWSEGERVFNGLVVESARVVNKKFELSYKVARESLDDDMSGTVQRLVSRLRSGAGKFRRHEDKLVFSVIKNNSTALDAVALFSASHPVDISDSSAGTLSNTDSGALTIANLAATRRLMQEFKGADGDPINDDPRVILVPPALEATARKIVGAESIIYTGTATDNPETNVWRGYFTVIVCPYLAAAQGGSDSYWYMVDTTDPEDRALIYQVREEVEIVTRFNPSDPGVFDLDVYTWGARARRTAAAGNPRRIFRRTG